MISSVITKSSASNIAFIPKQVAKSILIIKAIRELRFALIPIDITSILISANIVPLKILSFKAR